MTYNENASKDGDYYIHESTNFDRTHMLQLTKSTFANPPWTFINLFLFAISPTEMLRRGFYASICATAVAFEMSNIICSGYHRKLWEKFKINCVLFYIFDIIIHWIPLVVFYQPPLESIEEELLSKCIAFSCNVVWGLIVSRGSMNLSNVYAFMEIQDWLLLWLIVFVTTFVAP